MAGGRKLMIWTIIAVVVLVIAVSGFFFLRSFHGQSIPVNHAVPGETVILVKPLELKTAPGSFKDKQNMLRDLGKIPLSQSFATTFLKLDSLLEREEDLLEALNKNDLLLAWLPGDTALELLVLFEVTDMLESRALNAFLTSHFNVTREPGRLNDHTINRINGADPFYFCISKGIFLGSPSLIALEKALMQADRKSDAFSKPEYAEIIQTSGKNVDANIYVKIPDLIKWMTGENESNTPMVADLLGQFASLDMLVKQDGMMLNGFFSYNQDGQGIDLFQQDGGYSSSCPEILPDLVSEFLKIGFSSFEDFHQSLVDLKTANGSRGSVTAEELSYFQRWTGQAVILAKMDNGQRLAVFPIRENTEPFSNGQIPHKESQTFMGVKVEQVVNEELISYLLWPFAGNSIMPYYCGLSNYIIFGDSYQTLQNVIRKYQLGKTLVRDDSFKKVTENITENSNLYYYLNPGKVIKDPERAMFSPAARNLISEDQAYRHFPAFTAQFTHSGDWLYASMTLNYTSEYTESAPYLWKYALDGAVSGGPFLVEKPGSNEAFFMLTDILDHLYMIASNGEVKWKRKLNGSLKGDISTLKTETNGAQILFNTTEQLYLMDWSGNDVKGFPLTLEHGASTGLGLVRYPDNGTFRVFVQGTDNKVSNFDLSGKKVKGWKEPELPSTPATVPQFHSVKKKDYLVFSDMEGNVLITDRRGKERIRIKGNFSNSERSGIYLNKTNSKGLFITSDIRGHLVYIPENGKVRETVFAEFSPDHYFFYSDMDGNGSEDFVYFDHQKMQVFDRYKKKMVDLALPEEPASKPLKHQPQSKQNSFLYRGESGIIYLVDHLGNIAFDEEIQSDSQPAVFYDKGLGTSVLVSKGNEIYLYPLTF